MATKEQAEALKQQLSRRVLRLPGVSGVGIERGAHPDEYEIVVHVEDDNPETRARMEGELGGHPVRIVRSGKFKKL